jgi:hypothetical protein
MGLSLYEHLWPFIKCTYCTYSTLLKIFPFALYTKSSVSTGFATQIMLILHILCYNGSFVTWMVISLTTANFKPLIFSMSGFALSYTMKLVCLPADSPDIASAWTLQKTQLPTVPLLLRSWWPCDLVAMESCLQSLCLAADISPGCTVLALSPHITILTYYL